MKILLAIFTFIAVTTLTTITASADETVYSLSRGWVTVPDGTPSIGTMSRSEVDKLEAHRTADPLFRSSQTKPTLYYSASTHVFTLSRPSEQDGSPVEDLGELTQSQLDQLGRGQAVRVRSSKGKVTVVKPSDLKNARTVEE